MKSGRNERLPVAATRLRRQNNLESRTPVLTPAAALKLVGANGTVELTILGLEVAFNGV